MKTQMLAFLSAGIVAGAMALAVSSDPEGAYVVHEWGTFTDVQGADGKQMAWNPQIAPDLPGFVYHSGFGINSKISQQTIQRMETPVLYFYSGRPQTIDVAVNFPHGTITEWYPFKPAVDLSMRRVTAKAPALHWPALRLLPATPAAEAALRTDSTVSHYYAARATDASLVQIGEGAARETEKFLFYRGTGDFQAPLTVKLTGPGATSVLLQNTGPEPLRSLFVYQITARGGVWLEVPSLKAGETQTVSLSDQNAEPFSELAPTLRKALVNEGLYEKEAAAMVKTWEDSWFGERGLRVLYTLPRAWTDRTLPLQLTPTAYRIERVMVARAELITPATEQALQALLDRYIAAPVAGRGAIAAEARALGPGRFLPPALQRVTKPSQAPEYYKLLSEFSFDALQIARPAQPVQIVQTAPTAVASARPSRSE